MNLRNVAILVVVVALAAGLQNSAYGTTMDLRAAALSHPALMHGWAFEGPDASTAGAPIIGALALSEHNAGNNHPADPTHIVYDAPGFDATSTAASTWRDVPGTDFQHGDAFVTDGTVTPNAQFSYEVLIKTGDVPIDGGTWDLGYVLAHRPGALRGYFLWQGLQEGPHDPATFPEGGASFASLTGGWDPADQNVILSPIAPDNWYYLATSYSVDTGTGIATVDSYIADLTAGQDTLSQASKVLTSSYDYGVAGPFGVGKRFDGSAEAFPGVLDEVYLYDDVVDAAVFQQHLDQLLIPEPSSLVLLALGAVCAIPIRRRRRS